MTDNVASGPTWKARAMASRLPLSRMSPLVASCRYWEYARTNSASSNTMKSGQHDDLLFDGWEEERLHLYQEAKWIGSSRSRHSPP